MASISVNFNVPECDKQCSFKFPIENHCSGSEDGHKSLIKTITEADEVSNTFLTKLIENKGNVGPADFPRCPHGFPYSIHECLYSPSHFTRPGDNANPDEVIARFVQTMLKHSDDLKKLPIDGEFNIGLGITQSDPDSNHRMDIYGTKVLPLNSPILAFIHGGYWQFGSRESSKSMVRSLVSSGIIVAIVGYDLAPKISLEEMIDEIYESLSFLNSWALERNSSGLFVSGHSAGAHLAFMGLQKTNVELRAVRGVVLLSGVYDLEPIAKTYINEALKLNLDSAKKLSPIRHLDDFGRKFDKIKLAVVVGAFDSPTFVENCRDFFGRLSLHYSEDSKKLIVLKNDDHFSLIENLSDMNSELFRFIYDFIQLN